MPPKGPYPLGPCYIGTFRGLAIQLFYFLLQLEDERSSLSNQSSEQQGDLSSLRKELLAAEQTRMELEADKASLCEKIKFLEGEREKVELDLRQVVR